MLETFFDFRKLKNMDFRVFPILLALMFMSLLILSISPTLDFQEATFFTPLVQRQIRDFTLGFMVYFLAAAFDYNKLREYAPFLYLLMILSLVGLFFTQPIQGVYRWYRLPVFNVQPSEFAKLIVVITLSWFLERSRSRAHLLSTAMMGGVLVGIPFLLILKQPDLGTSLILFPMTLVMFYFGEIHSGIVRLMSVMGCLALAFTLAILLGFLPHDTLKPYVTKVLKEYQYERLNPNDYHQKAAVSAIGIGGFWGQGWNKGDFTSGGWLPAAYTDSVFPNYAEHFGFLGMLILLSLYYALLYFSFKVSLVTGDPFGRLLSAGIAVYLAMHILVNIGMMCGLLPITGVPLVLLTYGGSSIIATLGALGILQSIYSRRFMF